MYTEIGSFDAKAKLSGLLREVQEGHRFTITVRGRPIADLVPSESSSTIQEKNARAAVEAMRNVQKIENITSETILDWIAEGRK